MAGVGPEHGHGPAGVASERPTSIGTSGLLWLVLFVQLAIPSSYYLGRADREDERFAWRMFSALRFRTCRVQAFDELHGWERRIPLSSALHASWIGTLRRGRERVIERFLRSRCEEAGVEVATLVRSCQEIDNRALPTQRFRYACETGRLSRESVDGPL